MQNEYITVELNLQQMIDQMNASQSTPGENPLSGVESKPPEEKPPETKPVNGRQCHKCGAFVEIVQIATDEHLPGYYCKKEGCGWTGKLSTIPPYVRDIRYTLPESLIELIMVAPLNETARAQVLARLMVPIPKSCLTYEDIVQWVSTVEFKHTKQGRRGFDLRPHPTVPRAQFEFQVDYMYTENGTCNWHLSQHGYSTYRLTAGEVQDIAEDSTNWDSFRENIASKLRDMCNEDPPECDPTGDYSYADYEHETSNDHDTEVGPRIGDELYRWMERNLPETLAELEG